MPRRRPSSNYRTLRSITSKMRQLESSRESQYLIIYSFLYKYCSDKLKVHLLDFCRQRSISLDEAFRDEIIREAFKKDAIAKLGYFINDSKCFFDRVIDDNYQDRFFLFAVYEMFCEHIEFGEDSKYRQYFEFIFKEVDHAVNFNKFEFTNPKHLIVKEIIFSISKLDVFEEGFPFEKVFDRFCQSRQVNVDHDPDYINELISAIVNSNAKYLDDIYNPFLNDASLLVNLFKDSGFKSTNIYAKGQDQLTYCCGLIKLLMNGFDLNSINAEFSGPLEPFEDVSLKFDVIMSRFPTITQRHLRMLNVTQSYEILKKNQMKQVKSLLSDKLNIDEDSFDKNSELNNALENLIDKMDFDMDMDSQFVGEYESLKDSEYLFLINMINSLKDDGIMVVGMHQSFLVKNSLQTLRKFLTLEKNCVDAIISIPDELSRPERLQIIMVFRKKRLTDEIVFIDTSKDFKTKKAPYAMQGSYNTRNLVLADSTISDVLDVYNNQKIIDKFSNVVKISDLKSHDYNLSISRYVDTFEGEFINLEDLKNQKSEIDKNQKKLNKKIELMMKELDIRL